MATAVASLLFTDTGSGAGGAERAAPWNLVVEPCVNPVTSTAKEEAEAVEDAAPAGGDAGAINDDDEEDGGDDCDCLCCLTLLRDAM